MTNTTADIDWTTELTFTQDGRTYPFVEDENCNITGHGHQDLAEFAAAINRWDDQCGADIPEDDRWTADDITHRWARVELGGEFDGQPHDWLLHAVPPGTPGAIAVTTLWGQR